MSTWQGSPDLAKVREVASASGAIVHTYLMPDRYIAMTRVAMGDLLALAAGGDLTRLDRLARRRLDDTTRRRHRAHP